MANDIAVLWIPKGLEPLSSCQHYREPYKTITEAVAAVVAQQDDQERQGKMPWLRAGTGKGTALLNDDGIRLLQEAMSEGRNL